MAKSNSIPAVVDGTVIFIEVENKAGLQDTGAADKVVAKTKDALEQAEQTIIAVSKRFVEAIHKLDAVATPDEFTLEFGIKFTGEANLAVLAKAGAEASLKVTMKYNHTKVTPAPVTT